MHGIAIYAPIHTAFATLTLPSAAGIPCEESQIHTEGFVPIQMENGKSCV